MKFDIRIIKYLGGVVGLFLVLSLKAQNISITFGPEQVPFNQAVTITITVENDRLREYGAFPEIPGLIKRGTSSSSSTNIINGQVSSTQSITQNYFAEREGVIAIPPFTMVVNGEKISSSGKRITILAPSQQRQTNDPFEDIFSSGDRTKEFIDIKDEAFLALTVDKKDVFLGEGYTTTLAFYVPQDNRAPLEFYDLGKQLVDIRKKISPANSWEENFSIENINRETVVLNNKVFSKYKIFQSTNYPLTLDPISIPSVSLKMIKYKVAKNPSFFGRNRHPDFKTFYSKAKKVVVKPLPPHPLKDQVAVGNYRLRERINSQQLETGKSFNYRFSIRGEGNISAINDPTIKEDQNFDFYSPNVKQDILRSQDRVTGEKTFSYFGIPNEPGIFKLENYFQWIYFNTQRENYDTLRSSQIVTVTGESKRNEYILSTDVGVFYDIIEIEDNQLTDRSREQFIKVLANILILMMLILTAVFIFKK